MKPCQDRKYFSLRYQDAMLYWGIFYFPDVLSSRHTFIDGGGVFGPLQLKGVHFRMKLSTGRLIYI